MPRHIRVPAIVALLLVALTPRAGIAEPAGNDCLVKPNSTPPQGSHWYYRVDRTANRRCWFLGPEGLKVRQAEAPKRLLSPASTPQLNPDSEIRPEVAAADSVPNISSSASSSISQSDRETRSTIDVVDEHPTAESAMNLGTAAGVSPNAAAAEPPSEQVASAAARVSEVISINAAGTEPPPEQVAPGAAQASEVISTSMWPKQMLAAGAGALLLITVVLLLVYRPFGSFVRKPARNSKSYAKSNTKTVHPRNVLTPAPARDIAADSQADLIRWPVARARAFTAARDPLTAARPTNDLEEDLRWLLDRSRRRAA
jgi:hypothetical protein